MTQPKGVQDSLQQAVAREYVTRMHTLAKAAAAESGPAPESVTLSREDEDARWNHRRADIAPEQMPQVALAVAQGLMQKLQEAGQPLPPREQFERIVASQVTRIVTDGMRREVTSRGFPKSEEQVARAKALRKRNEQPAEPMAEAPSAPAQSATGGY